MEMWGHIDGPAALSLQGIVFLFVTRSVHGVKEL
jgi:hypothetical protein